MPAPIQVMMAPYSQYGAAVLTVGALGGEAGFNSTAGFGALSLTVQSHLVIQCSSSASADLTLRIFGSNDDGGQRFLEFIQIEDGSGVVRTYFGSQATYSTGGGLPADGIWSWGDGSNRVYVLGDSGETHPVAVQT